MKQTTLKTEGELLPVVCEPGIRWPSDAVLFIARTTILFCRGGRPATWIADRSVLLAYPLPFWCTLPIISLRMPFHYISVNKNNI